MCIPAYLRLSRRGIYYFRIIVLKASLTTRDQRVALRKARDLAAISAHKRFE